MTLVSALMGRHGVVMFSDNQETRGGYSKTTVDKLCVWDMQDMPFRLAIAGATDNATYLDMLERSITADLLRLNFYSPEEIENVLSNALTSFYAKHIWPQSNAPLMDFLISIQPLPNGRPDVIHVSGTAILFSSLTNHYKSIGVGSHLADYLFDLLLGGGQSQAELAMAAVYVGKQVSENVDGCGPIERVVLLGNDGEYAELLTDQIKSIEENMFALRQVFETAFIAAANVTDSSGPEDDLEYIVGELTDVRAANSRLWQEVQQKIKDQAESRSRYMPKMKSSPF